MFRKLDFFIKNLAITFGIKYRELRAYRHLKLNKTS